MKLKHQFFILCAVILATFSFISVAHSFEGAYIGGSVGGILSPVNHIGDKITDIVVGTGGMKINDHWHTARKPSMNFTINGGFGKLFDKHYCGVEASINKSRYRMKITKYSYNFELDTHDELNLKLRDVDYAIDYKHGYLLSKDTMVFAKAGVARTRARMSLASVSTIKYANVMAKHPSYLKNEKTIHPMRIGFGFEHKLLDNLSMTCDYTYSRYMRSFKLKGKTKSVTQVGTVTAEHGHKMTIQDTSIMMGLKTYF